MNGLERVASRWLAILGLKVIPILQLCAVVGLALLLLAVLGEIVGLTIFLFLSLFVLGLGYAVVALLCFVLALATITIHFKVARQWWVVRRTGLRAQFHELWLEKRQDRRVGPILIFTFIVCLVVVGLLMALWIVEPARRVSDHAVYGFFVVVACAPLLAWLAQRNRRWLETLSDVERLTDLLTRHTAASSESVVLPAAAVAQIAQIERTQIVRDRVAAVQGAGASASGYAVVKSAAAQAAIRALDLSTRLSVEDRIQELSSTPPPVLDGGTSTYREHVAGTAVDLVCELDRPAGRITTELNAALKQIYGKIKTSIELE